MTALWKLWRYSGFKTHLQESGQWLWETYSLHQEGRANPLASAEIYLRGADCLHIQ